MAKKKVYRAFPNRELKDVNFSNLGMHWTDNPQFASFWAQTTPSRNLKHIPEDSIVDPKTNQGQRYKPKKARVILEAEADLKHSVKNTDKDAEDIRKQHSIYPYDAPGSYDGVEEREITLRPKRPVKVIKAHEEVEEPTDRHFKEGFVIKDIYQRGALPSVASRTTHFEAGGKEGRV